MLSFLVGFLIALQGNDTFQVRQYATKSLLTISIVADIRPQLKLGMKSDDLEIRVRSTRVYDHLCAWHICYYKLVGVPDLSTKSGFEYRGKFYNTFDEVTKTFKIDYVDAMLYGKWTSVPKTVEEYINELYEKNCTQDQVLAELEKRFYNKKLWAFYRQPKSNKLDEIRNDTYYYLLDLSLNFKKTWEELPPTWTK